MRAVFLADAHLRHPTDANYQALLAFLDEQEGRTDLLALLGDICEFLVGSSNKIFPPYLPLFEKLTRLQRSGTQLIYVEGNHDFHLAPFFDQRLPCKVLPDGGPLVLDGQHILLVHGDMANPADHGYRLLRTTLRNPVTRLLIRLIPANCTWRIAEQMSQSSRRSGQDKRQRWPAREVLLPYARARLAEGYQAIVTGHFHQPFHEKLDNGEIIALGDWITQYSYAVWEKGLFHLKNYGPSTS